MVRKVQFGDIKEDISYCSEPNPYVSAYKYGKNILKSIEPQPGLAIMFDIDDTLLKVNCGSKLTPIKPMIKLLKYARKHGFIIVIITARPGDCLLPGNYNRTVRDLETNGICYDYLFNFFI